MKAVPCLWRLACVVLLQGLMVGVAGAQEFPNKPIRIVTVSPGSNQDFTSRLIAQEIAGPLGQQVIVENRPGTTGREFVAKAMPDGYTLSVDGSGRWVGPVMEKLPYDPVTDASPISVLGTSPNVLVVTVALPVKSVAELIALAKARPGAINYGAGGVWSGGHLAAELFRAMTKTNIVHINYKGNADVLRAVMTGEVQMTFANAVTAKPYVSAGRLRALGVTSTQPSRLAPGLPTVASFGLAGFESESIVAMFAPAKTPDEIVSKLNREVLRAFSRAEVKEKMFNGGMDTVGSSPDELVAKIRGEMENLNKLIKAGGLKV